MLSENKSNLQDADYLLQVNNALLSSLVESSDDAIISKSLDGTITSWNKAAETMFGYSANEIIGKPISLLVPKEGQEEFASLMEKIKQDQRIKHFETERIRKDGSIINVSVTLSPIKSRDGKIIGLSKIVRNISERRKNEEERIKLASIVESSDDAILAMDLNGKIVSWNRGAVKMFGYEEKELMGKSVQIIYPSERTDELIEIIHRLKSGSRIEHFETERKRKDGVTIDVSLSISPIKNKKGEIIEIAKIIRDISGQKRTSAYARSLIEASLDPLVTISLDGKITDVNEATVKVTGTYREELIGSDFSNYFTEPQKAREGYERVFKEGFVTDYPLSIRNSSGTTIDVLYNASVYKNDKGKVLGVFAAARDITETKKVSQYARSLIEASLDPLVTISPDGKITDVNEATVKVTGVDRMKLIGSDFSNYFTEPEEARDGYERVFKEGFVTDYPLTIHHSSGTTTDVLYNASVYKNDKGKVLGAFAAARNATRVRQKDEFSTMLTHELKTPLAPIIGYCKMFTQSLFGSLTEEQIDAIHVIEKNARRLEVLINDIMDARKLDMGRMKFKIEDISLDEFFKNLDSSYKLVLEDKGIKFVTKLLTNGITIQSDETRIRQVLDNIISNSINAVTKDRGLLIEIHAYKQNNKLIISIRDNGCGIPLEKQQELFKKFYQVDTSLRRRTGGTGLGLAISRGIMEKLGGSISIESDGKTGTTVHLTLPMNRSIINNTEAMI